MASLSVRMARPRHRLSRARRSTALRHECASSSCSHASVPRPRTTTRMTTSTTRPLPGQASAFSRSGDRRRTVKLHCSALNAVEDEFGMAVDAKAVTGPLQTVSVSARWPERSATAFSAGLEPHPQPEARCRPGALPSRRRRGSCPYHGFDGQPNGSTTWSATRQEQPPEAALAGPFRTLPCSAAFGTPAGYPKALEPPQPRSMRRGLLDCVHLGRGGMGRFAGSTPGRQPRTDASRWLTAAASCSKRAAGSFSVASTGGPYG
jgi:hypothetical protein